VNVRSEVRSHRSIPETPGSYQKGGTASRTEFRALPADSRLTKVTIRLATRFLDIRIERHRNTWLIDGIRTSRTTVFGPLARDRSVRPYDTRRSPTVFLAQRSAEAPARGVVSSPPDAASARRVVRPCRSPLSFPALDCDLQAPASSQLPPWRTMSLHFNTI
jgi:hypothetical protein